MPDIDKIVGAVDAAMKLLFPGGAPGWVHPVLGAALLVFLALLGVAAFMSLVARIASTWNEKVWPLFYDREKARLSAHRRRFAAILDRRLMDVSQQEEWSDHRFAELEAEVEAEGRRRGVGLLPFLRRDTDGLRRERSLSRALEVSRERLILVEGEPGSGKSVALRHVAHQITARAARRRDLKSPVPIYLNLKELERRPEEVIDDRLIARFVLASLDRINDRDIAAFLDDEFDAGIAEGLWVFVFDSFDEIPEVLSASEADEVVRAYGTALRDFLTVRTPCRGIVASRRFHGPAFLGWPRFRIVPLSDARRRELVERASLRGGAERALLAGLTTAAGDVAAMASNPQFLTLLCDHMRDGQPFPDNVHEVFEKYVGKRLTRDAGRLRRRFDVAPAQVRELAEWVGFAMGTDAGLGLSPTREAVRITLAGLEVPAERSPDALFDALEFIKLARVPAATGPGSSPQFTFAHRRFQEYFATAIVLRSPALVPPRRLLTDGRWRETAVVLLQTRPLAELAPLLSEAERLLGEACSEVVRELGMPPDDAADGRTRSWETRTEDFPWPAGARHLVGLLQDGLSGRAAHVPDAVRQGIGFLLRSAMAHGMRSDWHAAIEVAGLAPDADLEGLLVLAFESGSQWLREAAYRQAARADHVSPKIARGIRRALRELYDGGWLGKQRLATEAHLNRLRDRRGDFLAILDLLLLCRPIDLLLHAAVAVVLVAAVDLVAGPPALGIGLVAIVLISATSPRWPLRSLGADPLWVTVIVRGVIGVYGGFWLSLSLGAYVLPAAWAVLWFPAALLAVDEGRFVQRRWWPVLPAVAALHLANELGVERPTLRRVASWSRTVLVSLALMGAAGVIGTLLIRLLPDVIWSLAGAAALLTTGFTLRGVALRAYLWAIDWLRWRRFGADDFATRSAADLWALAVSFRLSAFRVRLLRANRQRAALLATAENDAALTALAATLEGAAPIAGDGTIPLPSDVTDEEIDEVFLLRQQVRAGRPGD